MPVRAIIILFDVWHTNVLLAPICDKNRLNKGFISFIQPVFLYLSLRALLLPFPFFACIRLFFRPAGSKRRNNQKPRGSRANVKKKPCFVQVGALSGA